MRVSVDKDRCIGSGMCSGTTAEVFDQSEEDGVVVLLTEQPAEAEHAHVRTAARQCPVRAITLTE
jgi:ferredoxin